MVSAAKGAASMAARLSKNSRRMRRASKSSNCTAIPYRTSRNTSATVKGYAGWRRLSVSSVFSTSAERRCTSIECVMHLATLKPATAAALVTTSLAILR